MYILKQCVDDSLVSASPRLTAIHATALTALAPRNSTVQTASLQWFSVTSCLRDMGGLAVRAFAARRPRLNVSQTGRRT